MAKYEVIHQIPDANKHFTGMVVARERGVLCERVEYCLVVKNNKSGKESKEYPVMEINGGPDYSEAENEGGYTRPSILFGVPVFTESGLEVSVDEWPRSSTCSPLVKKKELKKVVIPRDKFPE